jgi:uncharacterized protein YegL
MALLETGSSRQRRLPVYILFDSPSFESVEDIEKASDFIQNLVEVMRSDPYALETVFVSAIICNSKKCESTELVELFEFKMPHIKLGANIENYFSKGLTLLCSKIDQEVVKTTAEQKGDWRPIVLLFTKNIKEEEILNHLDSLKKCNISSIGILSDNTIVSDSVLKQVSRQVLVVEKYNKDILQFFYHKLFNPWRNDIDYYVLPEGLKLI